MASEQPSVLFVTGEYPPMLGGVGRFTAELARALQAQGAQITVLTDKQVPPSAEADAVRVLAQTGGWGWRLLTDIPACAREIGAEWVHVQYQTAAYGMHPAINTLPYFLRRHGLRAAWTYHDLRVPYLFPKAGARLRRWVTRLPLRAADAVVVTNQSELGVGARADAARSAPPHSDRQRHPKQAVLGCGAEPAPGRRRGYGSEQLVLGYFGFLNASKGGLTLVETLAALVQGGTGRSSADDRRTGRGQRRDELQLSATG